MFPVKTARRLPALITLLMLFSSRAALAQRQRAILEVFVNQVSYGNSLVVLRDADVFVPVVTLTDAGLHGIHGERETIGAREFVSLTTLAPAVAFRMDERELRLDITASAELLGERIHTLAPGTPADLVFKANTSGFLNYAVNYATNGHANLFAESAFSLRGALLYNTVSTTGGSPTRGLTAVTIDQRASMRRWTFGDSLGYSGPLGGDSWIAGVTVAKEFAINPYFVKHPTLSLSTPISVPSVMEVQINGQVVSREQVAPGRLQVNNLPMTLGRNDAQVIVRDAFGVERQLSSTFYLSTSALAKGVQDYQYSFGFQRLGVGEYSWSYRAPAALARHRVGLSNAVTAGGRFEVEPGHLFSGGPSLNLRLPVGEIEAATSASRIEDEWGSASLVGFSYSGRPISAGGSVMAASKRYATLTPNPEGEDPSVAVNVFASASLGGPVSLTTQHVSTRMHQGLTRSLTSVLSTVHLARNVELTASVSQVRDEHGSRRELYAGMSVLFGRVATSVANVRDERGNRMSLDAHRSLPVGEGYGYQVHAESGGDGTGVAQYQTQYGRYELRQDTLNGANTTTFSAAGSIVGIGGGIYASRPVDDSFALVKVPGVAGVRAFASHQEIGRTNRNGDLLIPDLQAYYGNILNVADADIPLQYAVPDVARTLALPYRGGAVALFDVQKIQHVTGRLSIADGGEHRVPSYGDLTVVVNDREVTSPVGNTGAFYFETLKPGTYPALVHETDGHDCVFTVTVPASDAPIVNLGTLRCEAHVS